MDDSQKRAALSALRRMRRAGGAVRLGEESARSDKDGSALLLKLSVAPATDEIDEDALEVVDDEDYDDDEEE